MTDHLSKPCTAFHGSHWLSSGPLVEVVLAVKAASEHGEAQPLWVFDDATGRVIDVDLRGTKADVINRLAEQPATHADQTASRRMGSATTGTATVEQRGRGRPKLGVVGREVTLLPRQWEWLAAQPGGASVVLRKLVDEARRNGGATQKMRVAHEAAYHFMSAMAGDLPGFEEATRALFANDRARFEQQMTSWPTDLRNYAVQLGFGGAASDATRE